MLFKARTNKQADLKIMRSAEETQTAPKVKGGILSHIAGAVETVQAQLGKYADDYIIIREEAELKKYVEKMVKYGEASIDTETDGLDTMDNEIAGVCLYVPGEKPAYVPIHHKSYITLAELNNQLKIDFIAGELKRLVNTKLIMHNGKFDLEILHYKLGVDLSCAFDTMLAAWVLDENEPHGLKYQYSKYCSADGEYYKFEDLFNGIPFNFIPVKTAYLYAARDPYITYELYLHQKRELDKDEKLKNIFYGLEMPMLPIVVDVKKRGIGFDPDEAKKLHVKYFGLLEKEEEKAKKFLSTIKGDIAAYKIKNPKAKLDEPINLNSPAQCAILFYDILKITPLKDSRSTDEKTLTILQDKCPLIPILLEMRGYTKLLSTYIDKMPEIVKVQTGRIHCDINQYGARTGRMSSDNPNMQNIPAKAKDIRKMFMASPGKVIISCDYSQQEPRILAHMSQDPALVQAYKDGKDLYAQISSLTFNKPYEACLEHFPDGTINAEGKKLRGQMKAIVLGLMYDRKAESIAEALKISKTKAEELFFNFFRKFPGVKEFIDNSVAFARREGCVRTLWGRKRRLPELLLPPYEFTALTSFSTDFDPLNFNSAEVSAGVPPEMCRRITARLNRCRWRNEKTRIIEECRASGIVVKDNTYLIQKTERQVVNSIIQGSAADMTKEASINCFNDDALKKLKSGIILWVHDEILSECPRENAAAAVKLIKKDMLAAASRLTVPMKADAEVVLRWYGEEVKI